MLSLEGIRQFVSDLGVAEDSNVYIGKLNNKKQHAIGIYPRKESGPPVTALGGAECLSYDIRRISILIHWDKDVDASEHAAFDLFEKLRNISSTEIDGIHINAIMLRVPEPVSVGTDDNGVYEYVIWLDFIYQKERNEE